jgi:hypothetical protein
MRPCRLDSGMEEIRQSPDSIKAQTVRVAVPSAEGVTMRTLVQIENIEEMRQRNGIDDVELRKDIVALRRGDVVRVTLMADASPFARQSVLIRITRIAGFNFRGKLLDPLIAGLTGLRPGSMLAFHADHIHSIAERETPHAH